MMQLVNAAEHKMCQNVFLFLFFFLKKGLECYKSSINDSPFTTVLNGENTAQCGQIFYVLCKNGQTVWRYY